MRTYDRIEILEHHGLKVEHFVSNEEAIAAADELIDTQRAAIKGIPEQHPDKIFESMPILNQYWYAKHNGNRSPLRKQFEANIAM
jgi:hypothetical protein